MDNYDIYFDIDLLEQYEWLSNQVDELFKHKDILDDTLDPLLEDGD